MQAATRAPGAVQRRVAGAFGAKRYSNSIAANVNIAATSQCTYGQIVSHNDWIETVLERSAARAGSIKVKLTATSNSTPTARVRTTARILFIHNGRGVCTLYTMSRLAIIPLLPIDASHRVVTRANDSNLTRLALIVTKRLSSADTPCFGITCASKAIAPGSPFCSGK